MTRLFAVFLIVALSGCSRDPAGIRITQEAPPSKAETQPRSEPVFYNGKTYQLDFAPAPVGGYAMTISHMSAAQRKDAEAVATSALRQFACKAGQQAKLLTEPNYASGQWHMMTVCG